jgi:hypothetical protein
MLVNKIRGKIVPVLKIKPVPQTEPIRNRIHVLPASKTMYILTRMAMFNARTRMEAGKTVQTQAGNGNNQEISHNLLSRIAETHRPGNRVRSVRAIIIQAEHKPNHARNPVGRDPVVAPVVVVVAGDDKIANSEQRHMDRILCLLTHYEIEDPASTEAGVFNNPELQELYNTLIDQGSASLVDALSVGATIEDVDIYDLDTYVTQTSNEAILTIFGRLTCGSRNHMRAFSGLLADNSLDYTPQFISQEQYDDIITGSHEMCGNGNGGNGGNGNGNGNCPGNGNGGNGGNGNGCNNGNGGNCP